jgi:hypothetical protein
MLSSSWLLLLLLLLLLAVLVLVLELLACAWSDASCCMHC